MKKDLQALAEQEKQSRGYSLPACARGNGSGEGGVVK